MGGRKGWIVNRARQKDWRHVLVSIYTVLNCMCKHILNGLSFAVVIWLLPGCHALKMPCQIKRSLKDVQWFKGLVHFQNKNVLIIYSFPCQPRYSRFLKKTFQDFSLVLLLVFLFSDKCCCFFEEIVPGYFSIYGTLMLANGLKVQIAISMVSTWSEPRNNGLTWRNDQSLKKKKKKYKF